MLRVIVAPGFMPVASATDGLSIQMCTGQGAVTVHVPGKPDHQAQKSGCEFGGLASVAVVPLPPLAATMPVTVTAILVSAHRRHSPNTGVPAPPPPATGPPSLI